MKTALIAGNSLSRTISSQASKDEGSTTRSKDRRSKWIETGGIHFLDGDIVSSVWQHTAARNGAEYGLTSIFEDLVYGALGNPGSRFFDARVAQSTTLSGRCIVKHMGSKINEIITGDYNHTGLACIYGDSVTGDTLIRTDSGEITIEQLYNECVEHCIAHGKEYGLWSQAKVIGFNSHEMESVPSSIEYVMRHKTKKKLYRITTENGKQVTVTEDHSVMVDRDGFLIEVKPNDILAGDNIITLTNNMDTEYTRVKSIECLGEIDDYVYDLSIKNGDPIFFGNDILLKNTDSIYFSAYPVMKDLPDFKDFEWTKENVTDLYDKIGEITNQSFPEFMKQAFNCPEKSGAIIRAARELCAIKGLFITKKRYAVLIYDKEGKRKDVNGKRGEIKAMGLDLKRSDTSKFISDFLSLVLTDVLSDVSREDIFGKIQDFRKQFSLQPSWEKGSPKRVNNLTKYANIKQNQETGDVFSKNSDKKKTIPGHVVASLNYNKLKSIFNDNESMTIQDGFKIIVCKLKPNNRFGMNSVAYPVDLIHIPDWFKQLPFDDTLMEETSIDRKLENLLGVLKWDLAKTKSENQAFSDLFEF